MRDIAYGAKLYKRNLTPKRSGSFFFELSSIVAERVRIPPLSTSTYNRLLRPKAADLRSVAWVTASDDEIKRIGREILLTCHLYQATVTKCR